MTAPWVRAARRDASTILGVLALLLVFSAGLVLGSVLHLQSPPARHAARRLTNTVLRDAVPGRIVIDRIGGLHASGARDVDAHVEDPSGETVIAARGVTGDVDIVALLRSIVSDGPLRISISGGHIRDAYVSLDSDDSDLALARAFVPEEPRPDSPGKKPVVVAIEPAVLDHAWVNGDLDGTRIDGDVFDARASVRVDEDGVVVTVERSRLALRSPGPAPVHGEATGRLTVQPEQPLSLFADLTGEVGAVPISGHLSLRGERFSGRARLLGATPEQLRTVWPDAPLRAAVSATVQAEGTFAAFRFDSESHIDGATLVARGSAYPPSRRFDFSLTARALDPSDLTEALPETRLTLRSGGSVRLGDGARVWGKVHASADAFDLQGTRVPESALSANLAGDTIEGDLRLLEPGLGARVHARLETSGGLDEPRRLHFEAQATSAQLSDVTRLPVDVAGSARVTAEGTVYLPDEELDVSLSTQGQDVRTSGLAAGSVRATARIHGPFDALRLRIDATAAHFRGPAGLELDSVEVTSAGTPASLETTMDARGESTSARIGTTLGFVDGFSARDTDARLARGRVRARVHARRVASEEGAIEVDRLTVDGIGWVEADGRWGPRDREVRLRARDLDVDAILRALDVRSPLLGFRSDLDVALAQERGKLDGSVALVGSGRRFGKAENPRVKLRATVDRDRLSGTADLGVGEDSVVRVAVKDFSASSGDLHRLLQDAVGEAEIYADVHAADVEPLVERVSGASALGGRLVLLARALRAPGEPVPDVDAYLETHDVTARVGKGGAKAAPRALGIDWLVRTRVDGSSGFLHVAGRGSDGDTVLADATVDARLPLSEWLASREAPEKADLERIPFSAYVNVPDGDLGRFKGMILPEDLPASGKLDLALHARGTLGEPRVKAKAILEGPALTGVELEDPVTLQADVSYDSPRGRIELRGTQAGREVLQSTATFVARAADWFLGGAEPEVSGTAKAELARFPLESLSWARQNEISGLASGQFEVTVGKPPALRGQLDVERARVGAVQFDRARAKVRVGTTALEARAELTSAGSSATVDVESAARIGEDGSFELDARRKGRLDARFDKFDLRAISPFTSEFISRIGGKLDGSLHLRSDAGKVESSGQASLRKGVLQIPALGQELRAIRFDARLSPDGKLEVREASARGLSGRILAEGTARLEGFGIKHGKIEARIPKGDEVPVTLQGVPLGRVSGRIRLSKVPTEDDSILLRLQVPKLAVELPPDIGRRVQALDPAERIEIGVHSQSGKFRPIQLEKEEDEEERRGPSKPTRLKVEFGKDVYVKKPQTFEARLAGEPELVLGDELTMLGQIEVKGGWVDVLGKRFTLNEGTITFQEEDPANPVVVATAQWESPEGYTIFVDYTGPVKTGKLELRSSPPLSESEVLSVLLFGGPSGQITGGSSDLAGPGSVGPGAPGPAGAGAGASSIASGAAGVGGGVFTAGLNRALSGLSDVEITTRVDTSYASGPRPEVMVQLSRRVGVEVAYNPNASLVARQLDRALLTLMLRLRQRWMLETTIGDAGTTIVDLIWRYRY